MSVYKSDIKQLISYLSPDKLTRKYKIKYEDGTHSFCSKAEYDKLVTKYTGLGHTVPSYLVCCVCTIA